MAVIPPPTEPTPDTVTLVTGLEGPLSRSEPVTRGYCHLGIVTAEDHATDCHWRPGEAER
ncbi:hypothetical protein [Streptomyces sp. NPDC127098]|uniref:hypothetical protein n=1 Tax=Streptomyces sp. NPDC127098 TaxID=3347137 RepID=UPI0036611236